MYEKKIANGNTTIGLVNKLIYAMVMLKTEEFKSRGAHLHYDAEHDVDDLSYDFIRCLEDEDKKKIIEAIKKEDVFPKLKDAFRDYNKSSF